MIKVSTALVILGLFAGANVVAAGVTRVLGEFTLTLPPELALGGWILVWLAAIGSALAFLEGAIPRAMKLLRLLERRAKCPKSHALTVL